MILSDIKQLNESTTPIHLTMILNEIVRDGKVSNGAQWVVLSQVIQLMKNGIPTQPRYMYENPSPKEFLDELKAISIEEQVKIAKWCLAQLMFIEMDEKIASFRKPDLSIVEWINFVNKAQD
jgi:hypothetical protein